MEQGIRTDIYKRREETGMTSFSPAYIVKTMFAGGFF